MADTYCIDTSALIGAWYESYKPARFPKVWVELSSLIMQGRLVSSALVQAECAKRSPELSEWLSDWENMFLPPDQSVQHRASFIINKYKGLVMAGKEKFAADPFVIATAEVHGFTVITEEKGPNSLKKIPGVCNALRLPCYSLSDLFDREEWTLG